MDNDKYIAQIQRVDDKLLTHNEQEIFRFLLNAGFKPEQFIGTPYLETVTSEFTIQYYFCN